MSTTLPTTSPSDERAGVGPLMAGIAIPYVLGVLMICAGLVIGGTIGFVVAFGSFLLLLAGVVVGLIAWISTDDD